MQEYERFHRAIMPVADKVCLVPFEVATQKFNAGIEHLNDRYSTDFRTLAREVGRDEVMAQVDAISRERKTVKDGVEPYSPKASAKVRCARKAEQDHLRAELREPACATLLTRCNKVYQEILPKSGLYELWLDAKT
ncbi:hypothetical protein K7H20_22835 [Salipiger manganoxidans]|uniref:hypothetical protein n=1 Tax=Salipiger marinus TaxID=555512 RepID=UPI001E5D6543|nr:hypothetical protein [Salipiger manganoxidans]MCD1620896.1 hypothetical protein [Salipiger manganoxidans]